MVAWGEAELVGGSVAQGVSAFRGAQRVGSASRPGATLERGGPRGRTRERPRWRHGLDSPAYTV